MARSRRSDRKVFLSSTARDLGPYRDAVSQAISKLDGYQCVRMEDFGARDAEADPFCRALVAECDVFVGLVGYLYGSAPAGLSRRGMGGRWERGSGGEDSLRYRLGLRQAPPATLAAL